MLPILHWMKREFLTILPAILYFAVCFNLFHFALSLIMPVHGIRYTSYAGATLGALVAGKVILVVEHLPFINLFPDRPLIYNITWKFMVYGFFVWLVQCVDLFVHDFLHMKNVVVAMQMIFDDISQPHFWGVQILILSFFLIFIVFVEFTRAVGVTKTRKLFFG